ncbi:hypothetical protein B0H19DRAFT_1288161 [Mycena capillaripes]|nr:hypothetical protein B0H19DRAFT_1288161 [Mycena capillaripes]
MTSVQPISLENAKCVLVIGATSCIGRALALAISELPGRPTVIAAGRREDRLNRLEDENLETLEINVTADLQALKKTVASVVLKYPNVSNLLSLASTAQQRSTEGINEINVNYSSVVSLISALMPHFLKLSGMGHPSFIIPIISGLGVMPSPSVPNYYSASKALRSLTTSLRAQLKNTKINVLEIIPP